MAMRQPMPYGYPTPYPNAQMPMHPQMAMHPQMNPQMAMHPQMNPQMMMHPQMNPQMAQMGGQFPVPVTRNYSGPLPPNPVANQAIMQMAYQQQFGHPGVQPYANPAMDRPGMKLDQVQTLPREESMYQMLITLKTSLYPAHREWAALQLANMDWRKNPVILQAILTAAKEDPAAKVRAGCVNALVRMQVAREVMQSTLESMRSDVDPRVREAVEEALGTGPISGVSHSTPALPPAPPTKY
jgi:hypothetical protein